MTLQVHAGAPYTWTCGRTSSITPATSNRCCTNTRGRASSYIRSSKGIAHELELTRSCRIDLARVRRRVRRGVHDRARDGTDAWVAVDDRRHGERARPARRGRGDLRLRARQLVPREPAPVHRRQPAARLRAPVAAEGD